jgi:hypothetical protein
LTLVQVAAALPVELPPDPLFSVDPVPVGVEPVPVGVEPVPVGAEPVPAEVVPVLVEEEPVPASLVPPPHALSIRQAEIVIKNCFLKRDVIFFACDSCHKETCQHYPCHVEYRTRSRTNSGEKAEGDSKLCHQDMDRKLIEKQKK